ncbi:MAG: 6-hydroxycyclohex-1-ene-1-carbonyl-CoA dehydrogenase [Planctomycetes bacterium]|nr:6-hydroxycyclohex-1-ene-1-carbonyl-CoA dehydrogenase [Planctomycetota bacterium]MCW8135993.1 6-hydroxycyclohex-1-ene-1-carbonyl-CoA dehydrogenase [Planctomycetota bacterium]
MYAQGFAYSSPAGGFRAAEYPLVPRDHEVVVRVAGCGLCHTDVGFYYGDVAPRAPLPLVLGHEISGEVVSAGARFSQLVGASVVVPSVVPCGDCERCAARCENTCARQFMPGNDGHGGFASHVKVPGAGLAVLPADLKGYALHELSVIADAVTTPWQTVLRAGIGQGQAVVVVGVGGIGGYAVQLAAAQGAKVVAIDIDDAKLDLIRAHGAFAAINCRGAEIKDVRKRVQRAISEAGLPDFGWKVLEMSGTPAGQELAFSLLPPSGTLAVVGFTPEKLKLRLSNLMAFDATAFGNWGCAPRHYPAAIDMVLSGRVTLKPFIKSYPLEQIGELFEAAHAGKLQQRAILVPPQEEA